MVYIFDKHNIKLGDIIKYMYLLDDDKKKKFDKANNKKKIELILGRLLLKYVLKKELSIIYKKDEISYNKCGKPYLINNPNVNFSIAHSGDLIICAIEGFDIGADIEKIRMVRYGVVNNYFFDFEIKNLSKLNEKFKRIYFYYVWTARESFMKNIGTGISICSSKYKIQEYNMDYQIISYRKNKYYIYNYLFNIRKEEYIVSICSTKRYQEKFLLLNYGDIIV